MIDHVSVSLTTTPSVLYTVPKGATQAYITIQNRDTTSLVTIGDSSLAAIGSVDGGIKLPAVSGNVATSPVSTIQFWANGGDVIYGMRDANPTIAYSCIVLASYVQTATTVSDLNLQTNTK